MNKIKKIALLAVSYSLFAANYSFAAGLVPCGGEGEPGCNWCYLFQLFKNIIDFAMMIIFPIATVMMIYGGFLMMTAGDNQSRFGDGKKAMTSAVIGILIALLSWLILDTIFKMLAVDWDRLQIGPWNELSC
jgi:hypothetical protein